MRANLRLTPRDRQLKYLLTHMGVILFPYQLAWFWDCTVPRRFRLQALAAHGHLDSIAVTVRRPPIFSQPRLTWRLGERMPNVERASYQSRKTWFQSAARNQLGFIASRRTLAEAGVRKHVERNKLGHDAAITQVAMVYLRERDQEWRQFRHESLTDYCRIGMTVPDALLVDTHSYAATRAIEVCSGYRTDTLKRKVEACVDAAVEIEVWG